MTWLVVTLAVGSLVGSLLGLLSLRLPKGAPVGLARSACQGCGRPLGPLDLVPLVSFLALRGRCRTCGSPIPRRYILLELACLGLAVWSLAQFDGPLAFWSACLGWQLILLAVLDIEHLWLPRLLTLPLIASGLAVAATFGATRLTDHAIGALAAFLSLSLVAEIYRRVRGREGLGGGDAYLFAGAGAWVGWMALPSVLLLAAASGLAVVGLARLFGRQVRTDQPIPFGAFLALATWLVWLYGPIGVPSFSEQAINPPTGVTVLQPAASR